MNRLILPFCILFLHACSSNQESNFAKIENFIQHHGITEPLSKFKKLIIINDKGTCIQCNNDFSKMISTNLNDKTTLFIISQDGTKVNISAFLDSKNSENLILDFKEEFSKLNIVDGCAIIEIKEESLGEKTIINTQNIKNYQSLYN